MLWSGRVLQADLDGDGDSDVTHIRTFNDWLVARPDVESVMLPIADGVTMARKR
ncbi:MAG: hypothetical protein NVS3B18_13380 [Candidatus Dormibacteria bacterium]